MQNANGNDTTAAAHNFAGGSDSTERAQPLDASTPRRLGELKTVSISNRRLVVLESLKQLLGLVEDKKTA